VKGRLARSAPSLAGHWRDVAGRVRGSAHVAMFFDFDGTLVPFARRPDQVRMSIPMRRLLRRLAGHPRVTLFVISGRRRHDLTRHVRIPHISYLGLYGWEYTSPFHISTSARAALADAGTWLQSHEARYPGLWLEDKRVSLSVHLREVRPHVRQEVRRDLHRLCQRLGPAVRLIDNLQDAEFVPRSVAGKGAAVRRLLAEPPLRNALPVYFGDDLSDEPAFAAVCEGIAVMVGSTGPTHAHYAIPQRARLTAALRTLMDALP
jgi:trehalose 6-phosphate phosphatase